MDDDKEGELDDKFHQLIASWQTQSLAEGLGVGAENFRCPNPNQMGSIASSGPPPAQMPATVPSVGTSTLERA